MLRNSLERDWAGSSYGTIAHGPRVGEKRKMGREKVPGGKRVKVRVSEEEEEGEGDSEW